jgi:hypothetical protein
MLTSANSCSTVQDYSFAMAKYGTAIHIEDTRL